jgi:hypothetical protein
MAPSQEFYAGLGKPESHELILPWQNAQHPMGPNVFGVTIEGNNNTLRGIIIVRPPYFGEGALILPIALTPKNSHSSWMKWMVTENSHVVEGNKHLASLIFPYIGLKHKTNYGSFSTGTTYSNEVGKIFLNLVINRRLTSDEVQQPWRTMCSDLSNSQPLVKSVMGFVSVFRNDFPDLTLTPIPYAALSTMVPPTL